jgi:hypothetical protein
MLFRRLVGSTTLKEPAMKFRLSMVAAVILFSSTTAFAGDISTDAARARAAEANHGSAVAPVTATRGVPTTTDQARALAVATPSNSASRPVLAFAGAPASTDQARALAAGGARVDGPSSNHKGAMACAQACACRHG